MTKEENVDLTEKVVSVPFNAPISIIFDQGTDSLWIENEQANPDSPHITMRAVFSAEAIQQLLSSLKKIEDALKMVEERPAETNFLDKTNIL
ncbi:MAG: hypothetical protein LBM56_00260 [Burkholderiaceae bacterium]|jgi:hypothetical protein|nr:hypothetical protein [Burkholderiaceae bacterium]